MISQHHALICNLDGWHTATTCIVRVYIYRSFTGIWLVSARCQLGLHGYWKSADHLCGLETHSLVYIMVSQLFCYKKGCLSRFVAPDSSGYTVYPAVIRPHPTWFSGPLSYALRQTPCYTTHRLASVALTCMQGQLRRPLRKYSELLGRLVIIIAISVVDVYKYNTANAPKVILRGNVCWLRLDVASGIACRPIDIGANGTLR